MSNRRIRKKRLKQQHQYKEEYAIEYTPSFFATETQEQELNWFSIPVFTSAQFIGYIGLFIALLSLGMYPILFGFIGVIFGIVTVSLKEDTLGFTTVGFGLFSLLFSLSYQLLYT